MSKKNWALKIGIIVSMFVLVYVVYFVSSPFPHRSNYLICLTGDIDNPSLTEPAKENIKNLFDVFQENEVGAYTVFITTRSTPISRSSDFSELSNTVGFLKSETEKRDIRLEIASHSSFHYYIDEEKKGGYNTTFIYETMKQSINDLKRVGVEVEGYRPPNYLWIDDMPKMASELGFKYGTSLRGGEIRPSLIHAAQDYQSNVTLNLPYLAVDGRSLDDHFLLDVFKYDDETAGRKMYERVKELSYPGSTITIQMHPERSSMHIEFVRSFLEYLKKDSEREKYLFVTCSEAVELQRSLKAIIYAERKNLPLVTLYSQNTPRT